MRAQPQIEVLDCIRAEPQLTHPALPPAPAAPAPGGQGMVRGGGDGKRREVQNRSSGESRWRGEQSRGGEERAAAGRARAPDPAGNHNPETSSPPRAAALALPARSPGLCQCHGPPLSSSSKAQPSQGSTPTAPSALTSAPWPVCFPCYPSSQFYCPVSLTMRVPPSSQENTGPFLIPAPLISSHCTERGE